MSKADVVASATDYYRTAARQTYQKAIDAWLADIKAGKTRETEWAPIEYLIEAISVALAEERVFGFGEGENAGRKIR